VDINKLKGIPLQAHIMYYDMRGNKYVRVITRMQKVSHDRDDVEKDANISVLATHAVQKNSKLALEGKMKEAQSKAMEWENYMVNNLGSKSNKETKEQLGVFQEQNQQLILAIQSQEDSDKLKLENQDEISTTMYNLKQANVDMYKKQ